MQSGQQFSRRDMLKTTAAIGAAATLASFGTNYVHAAGSEKLRIGAGRLRRTRNRRRRRLPAP